MAFRSGRSRPARVQVQSEVSEIIRGRRQVAGYDVLVRIADGLGVPRSWMGLTYDESSMPYFRTGAAS
jgi:hypothetical protein